MSEVYPTPPKPAATAATAVAGAASGPAAPSGPARSGEEGRPPQPPGASLGDSTEERLLPARLPARLAAGGRRWEGVVHRLDPATACLLLRSGGAPDPGVDEEGRLQLDLGGGPMGATQPGSRSGRTGSDAPTAADAREPRAAVAGRGRDAPPAVVTVEARVVAVTTGTRDHRGAERTEVRLQLAEGPGAGGLEQVLASLAPAVLLVAFPPDLERACRRTLFDLRVEAAATPAEALEILDAEALSAICLGPDLGVRGSLDLLDEILRRFPGSDARLLVLGGGDDLTRFLPLIEEDRLYFLTPRPPAAEELAALLRAAAEAPAAPPVPAARRDALLNRALREAQEVAQHGDLVSLSLAMREATADLLHATRAHCLFHDPPSHSLVVVGADGGEERRETAAVGLASFVVRTGSPVVVDDVGSDPRFDPDADDPSGVGDERFLAVPIPGPDGPPLGVLAVVRSAGQARFDGRAVAVLAAFARHLGPAVAVRLDRWLRDARGELQETETPEFASHIFRRAAVDNFRQGERGEGDVLRLSPFWMTLSYRLLLLVLVAGLLYGFFARVHQYATGPAVVLLGDAQYLTAKAAGTVAAVEVAAGDRVAAGELLLSFYDLEEAAELRRIEEELESQLRRRLKDPSDAATEQALVSLRAQRDLARSRLGQRSVRSPAEGVVGDVRVREGQLIAPGQVLVSLGGGSRQPQVVALVPGRFRPELAPGMEMLFELGGYRYAYQELEVTGVGTEIVGPAEAQRLLGPSLADAVELQGPVVPVYARLSSATFQAGGETLEYHNGMWGQAEIPVRSERVLAAVVPFLRGVFGDGGGAVETPAPQPAEPAGEAPAGEAPEEALNGGEEAPRG